MTCGSTDARGAIERGRRGLFRCIVHEPVLGSARARGVVRDVFLELLVSELLVELLLDAFLAAAVLRLGHGRGDLHVLAERALEDGVASLGALGDLAGL